MTVAIEMRPLSKLVGWAGNPKTHDVAAIQRSLVRFGFVAPVVLDDARGKIVAGHGRTSALRGLKAKKEPAPRGIVVEGKEWLVPCLVGVTFETEKEAEAYLLADNKLVEAGGWDPDLVRSMLEGMGDELIAVAGFAELLAAPFEEAPHEPAQSTISASLDEPPAESVCPLCKGTGRG